MFLYDRGKQFFTSFGGERIAVIKQKYRASIYVTSPVGRVERLLFTGFIQEKRAHLCINQVAGEQVLQLTAYSQSSRRVRISWQLGRFSGSAQQSAANKNSNTKQQGMMEANQFNVS